MNLLGYFTPGPVEVMLGLTCLGVLLGGMIALVVVLTSRKSPGGSLNPNLYPCPDCGRPVSRLAPSCPQCGRPLTPESALGDPEKGE